MIRINLGIFFVALSTLLLELSLLRVFDVILYSNISYFIITTALLMFGVAGIFSTLKPRENVKNKNKSLMIYTLLFGLFALLLLPALNTIPFDFDLLPDALLSQLFYFFLIYLFLAIPFFLGGIVFTSIFSFYSNQIKILYFYDLVGAAIGSALVIPLIPIIGPGGILFVVAGISFIAAALFSFDTKKIALASVISLILCLFPFTLDNYIDFHEHVNKRDLQKARDNELIEYTYWDPVSKIDIVDKGGRKHVAYDGGSQSSFIYPFDGNYKKLEKIALDSVRNHFWGRHVLISHYLKKHTDSEVLIIGSAAGQETKAALVYGASRVDAVEMVGAVVDVNVNKYAEYNGNIFNDKRVNAIVGEGRSYIRASDKKYDIIQIFSNHTSSSMASGTGAMATTYLQTAEAYKEFFTHLKSDGILHINHHIFAKMITTASLAWKELGLKDFTKHVVGYQRIGIQDNLPTLLIKMTPWTNEELSEVKEFYSLKSNERWKFEIISDPINSENNFLSDEFYSGKMSQETLDMIPYRVEASVDNKPYFNLLRKSISKLDINESKYVDKSVSSLLNKQLRANIIPMDVVHLILVGFVSFLFVLLFVFVPLYFSAVGKSDKWQGKGVTLTYFACLGAGFIIFELVFIQIFMKLIGFPLYTYSTIVFITLLSAGIGSFSSEKLNINLKSKWQVPFVGIIISSILIILVQDYVFHIFLSSSVIIRIFISAILVFPLGFFLGMPFPLGITAISKLPQGAIAWAWGMNGLFTTIGGLLSVIISIYFGFIQTIFIAILFYIVAFYLFSKLKDLKIEIGN